MAIANLTPARLREAIDYCPESGLFLRRTTGRGVRSGDVAGSRSTKGYIIISVDNRSYKAHRLAWLYVTGNWPINQIDHLDADKSNNRFANLREATNAENKQNQRKARSDNVSCGLLGVTRNNKNWKALISVDGERRYLGTFPTAELAHAAYLYAKRQLHPYSMI